MRGMAAPISVDLRERVIRAWQRKEGTWEELAERFEVGLASVNRWIGRFRQTGTVEPDPHAGGHQHLIPEEHLPLLRELVKERPDQTLPDLVEAYARRTKVYVSDATMGRGLRRAGISRKKSRWWLASESDRTSNGRESSSSGRSRRSIPKSSCSSTRQVRTGR